jgi:hypothetical protein
MSVAQTATENFWQHDFVEPGGRGMLRAIHTGLTASEHSYTIRIFLNFNNIHYLLRVIYESHFSTFFHTFDIKLCTNTRF